MDSSEKKQQDEINSLKSIIKVIKEEWILWLLEAESSMDRRHLKILINLIKKYNSPTILTKNMISNGLNPLNSSLIKKILQKKFAKINAKQLILTLPKTTIENFEEKYSSINNFYLNIKNYSKNVKPYPSTYLEKIDERFIEKIPISKLHWYDFNAEKFENKIIEINFDSMNIPPILTTSSSFNNTIDMAKNKIVYYIKEEAIKSEQFFSKYIQYKKDNSTNYIPKMFDFDLSKLKNLKNESYRENYTKTVMDKIISDKKTLILFLTNFDVSSKTDLHTFFPYSNYKSFDFLQSIIILKEIYLSSQKENITQLENLATLVLEDLKLFCTGKELKDEIIKKDKDLPEELYENIIKNFEDEYVYKKTKNGHPLILKYNIIKENKNIVIYIHYLNFNRYLTSNLQRIDENIFDYFSENWATKLNKHEFTPEMFSKDEFNTEIMKFISEESTILSQIISRKHTYETLNSLNELSRFSNRLLLHGRNEISKIFELNNIEIYNYTKNNILSKKTFIGKLIFKFLNWLSYKTYNKNGIETKKSSAIDSNKTISEKDFLNNININSKSELQKKLDSLWEEIPSETISRIEFERNIKDDTIEFFKDKKEVRISNFNIIIDKTIKRLLYKAPHLSPYRKKFETFTKYYIYECVHNKYSLRNKIKF